MTIISPSSRIDVVLKIAALAGGVVAIWQISMFVFSLWNSKIAYHAVAEKCGSHEVIVVLTNIESDKVIKMENPIFVVGDLTVSLSRREDSSTSPLSSKRITFSSGPKPSTSYCSYGCEMVISFDIVEIGGARRNSGDLSCPYSSNYS